jgi:hypothetical protein
VITFWVDRPGAFTIRNYLEVRGKPLRERFEVQPYDWDAERLSVAGGAQIFAALDQLSEPEREAVVKLRDQLAARLPGQPLLNDPRRCLLRPAMLALLAEQGVNAFRAFPAAEPGRANRFPVYVRGAYDHGGNLTDLLHSPAELRRALLALRLRGHRVGELLVVEFCDTRDRHGVFRKYAAYRVGDAVVPAHVMAGRHWMVKSESSTRTAELAREDLGFVENNPHEGWLRRVFGLAGVEFGRIDYGVLGGQPQVWEINLNPTMGRRPGAPPRAMPPEVAEAWNRSRELAHARLREAFAALDRLPGAPAVALTVEPVLRARIARAARERQRRRRVISLLSRVYHSPLGAPLRLLLPRTATGG